MNERHIVMEVSDLDKEAIELATRARTVFGLDEKPPEVVAAFGRALIAHAEKVVRERLASESSTHAGHEDV